MLYVVATPIGNLDDLAPRARGVLGLVDALACEDTRRTRALLSHFGIPRPARLVSYREHTEHKAGEQVVRWLEQGLAVALCSDGGYPGVSDPGYRLISRCVERELEIQVIPGASAVPVALLSSGLPTSSYTFKGYPPRKPGPLRRFFEQDRGQPHTLVFYESPFRVAKSVAAALEVLGDRRAAVCIELTKKFEKVWRGYLSELQARLEAQPVKGEVTVVVAGSHPKFRRPA